MKKKLLIVILFCLGIAGIASAVEVVNIDLNAYGDSVPYAGKGAYDINDPNRIPFLSDSTSHWNAYYGGWGKPMGSPKSAGLRDWNEPNYSGSTKQCTPWAPGVYGAQVWIGDTGTGHGYYQDTSDANQPKHGLLNDGFIKDGNYSSDPCIALWGDKRAFGAFGGAYDIYVYGSKPTHYTLKKMNVTFLGFEPNIPGKNIHIGDSNTYRARFSESWVTYAEANVSGGYGNYDYGKNYTVFHAVDINAFDANETVISNDGNDANMTVTFVNDGNSNTIYLSYSNVINGLQLVSRKGVTPILNSGVGTGTYIPGGKWNSASESPRIINDLYEGQYGFASTYGPSVADNFDTNFPGPHAGVLNKGEFMQYDISVDSENEGRYAVALVLSPYSGDSTKDATYDFYYDDAFWTKIHRPQTLISDSVRIQTVPIVVNMFKGLHSFKWELASDSNATGDNVFEVNFTYLGPIVDVNDMNDCNAVVRYGFQKAADLNGDCYVNYKDLDILSDNWLECTDPNQSCP